MDFAEAITALRERAIKMRGRLNTEEATKTALVLPFIKELGYDVFNPLEVVPEFVADVAGMKGEKVDYAIMQDDLPIMLIECKCCGSALDDIKKEQLQRYFVTLNASIGILTDGIRYLFYSTGDDGKNMDTTPFMEFNLEEIDPTLLPELRKLYKGKFDLEKTLQTVNELKFNRQVKLALTKNLEEPDLGFIDYFLACAEIKNTRKEKKETQYAGYVKRAFNEFLAEQVDARLKSALAASTKKESPIEGVEMTDADEDSRIETTQEELEGFAIIKAIMSKVVDPERVVMRDTQSYCGVLLDNKNTRPICRMHFNAASVKYLETFDAEKKGEKHKIESLSDIYQFEDALRAVVTYYDKA